ncbi:MAG TPA: SGNH/GDSL hydrolase family protein, partial [Methylocella sp.]|nr:SGNH/GDSL hydrolase family protein [Methylocella sp.]
MMAKSRWRRLRGIVLVNFGVLIGLYLLAEIALHIISSNSNPLFRLTAKTGLGIRDPVYHHTLRPKFDGFDKWGTKFFPVLTNSLGFRDASTRDVPLMADRKRIVFIGDSFTEGLGVTYQETFVGKFAAAFPGL